jgi:predicted MFS family arabinose efflux permease
MSGYSHASYFLSIQSPLITICLFTVCALACYTWSKKLLSDNARLAIASARTSLILINFGFWIGSLWGEHTKALFPVRAEVFAVAWALALIATAIWAWKRNLRWAINTLATFAGIHLYTQWFEHLEASPGSMLAAGILALIAAIGLRSLNTTLKLRSTTP